MTINENYDKIDGKYVKNESNYYHYTSTQAFHKIASSLINGQGLKGKFMMLALITLMAEKLLMKFV